MDNRGQRRNFAPFVDQTITYKELSHTFEWNAKVIFPSVSRLLNPFYEFE